MKLSENIQLTMFVVVAVGLNIFNAVTLKLLASQNNPGWIAIVIGIGFVITLNGLRMLAWHFANKRFPLSTIYPLTSIFYPLMLVVSFYFKEEISFYQIAGTVFITIGVFWIARKADMKEIV